MKWDRSGFSIIEAMIALAIASIGLLAIFGLQQQLVSGQRHYEQALFRSAMARNVMAMLSDLNPAASPEGRTTLAPNEELRWTSEPLNDFHLTAGFPNGDGPALVRIFTIHAEITDGAGPREQISFDRLGWRNQTVPSVQGQAPGPGGVGQIPRSPGGQ